MDDASLPAQHQKVQVYQEGPALSCDGLRADLRMQVGRNALRCMLQTAISVSYTNKSSIPVVQGMDHGMCRACLMEEIIAGCVSSACPAQAGRGAQAQV